MSDRPNVLLICLDQISPIWFSLHGHPLVRTPHMDQIGGTGLSFTRARSGCPTCIPARQSLMTGLDPWGINMFVNKGKQPFPAGAPKLAELMSTAGYQTHAVGKLHCYPARDRLGFHEAETDEEYRTDENGQLHDYERYLRDQGLAHRMTSHGIGPNQYGWRIDSVPEEHSPTHWVADRACNFIERRDRQKPFFLYASFRQPHPPFVVQPAYWEMYRDAEVPMPVVGDWAQDKAPRHWEELHAKHRTHLWWDHPDEIPNNIRAYAAMISHIDSMIGMLLGCLQEYGDESNTWVMLVSDHGEMLFDHRGFAKATPFRGSSGIAFFVKPPKRHAIEAGLAEALPRIDERQPVEITDVMPTILDIAGLNVPDGLDGRSVLPLLSNDASDAPLIRDYSFNVYDQNFGVSDGRYSYCWFGNTGVDLLFDWDNDPRECHDLADDPKHADVRERLHAALRDKLASHGDRHVVEGKLTVQVPKYPIQHAALGEKGMRRGRA